MRWYAVGLIAALSLGAGPARADKMAETLDISLSSRVSWVEIQRPMTTAPLAEGSDVIDASRPHLFGTGALMGGVARFGATLDGVRFGAGVGVVTVAGLAFQHVPLPEGMAVETGGIWGAPFEGYLGYAFGDARGVRPLLEVRGGVTVLQSEAVLRDPVLGTLGSAPLNVYLANLELRAGVRIPIGDLLFFEGGVGVSVLPVDIGPERGSLFFAFGLPVPFANAF